MLKSIFKNNINYENNRKKIKKQKYIRIIILCLSFLVFSLIINLYNSNQHSYRLRNIVDKANTILSNYGFYLQNIYISGEKNLQKKVILNTINPKQYKSIFDVNLFKIHNNLLLNQWVETVQIERILPNSIKIKIIEKKPVAIWQSKIGNKLITEDGSVISIANASIFKDQLPIVTGKEANKNILFILQILKQTPNLYKDVWSISYINKRRWNVHLKQGITVLLPEKKIYKAWQKIFFLQKKYKLLNLGLTEIDIRNENQIFGKINFDKKLYLKRKKI